MYYVYNAFGDWECFNTFAEAANCAIEIAFDVDDVARIVHADYVHLVDGNPTITNPKRVTTVGTPYSYPPPWNPSHPSYNELVEADYLADDRYL